jgi:hypothetical protein
MVSILQISKEIMMENKLNSLTYGFIYLNI